MEPSNDQTAIEAVTILRDAGVNARVVMHERRGAAIEVYDVDEPRPRFGTWYSTGYDAPSIAQNILREIARDRRVWATALPRLRPCLRPGYLAREGATSTTEGE